MNKKAENSKPEVGDRFYAVLEEGSGVLVCCDCYEKLMKKGYDGEYYDELDEQIEDDY